MTYEEVLTKITNTFYSPNENITVKLNDLSQNFYDGKIITLSTDLIQKFRELKIPGFVVYYHELGHHLYSQPLFKLLDKWRNIKIENLKYHDKYHYLLNWIEDYYIESQLLKQYPYMQDVLTSLKKIPPEYDIYSITKVFNYYYNHQKVSPTLKQPDVFNAYLQELFNLRSKANFGNSVISSLSIKVFDDTTFVKTLIEFYEWCVDQGIFPKDKIMPPLLHPSNHIEIKQIVPNPYGKNQQATDPQTTNTQTTANAQGQTDDQQVTPVDQLSNGGTYDEDYIVNQNKDFVEVTHITKSSNAFVEEFALEQRLFKQMQEQSEHSGYTDTLEGLLQPKYKRSNILQSKVNIQSFFNPYRLMDRELFLEQEHTYMNVALYRDISGSTHNQIHTMMHKVIEHIQENLSVDPNYFLYASGPISVLEIPYESWETYIDVPETYRQNATFKQMKEGTNSGAIADVISQQYNDTWLNIIVTDGDLRQLRERKNIESLLHNVFVIYVEPKEQDIIEGLPYVVINEEEDIKIIIDALNNMKKGV